MGGKIKSSTIAAEAAINELVGYDTKISRWNFHIHLESLEWKRDVRPAIKCFRRSVILVQLF